RAPLVSCIQEIRRALRDDARRPRYVETLHRRGYRFIGAPVGPERDRAARPIASTAAPSASSATSLDAAPPILVGRDDELARLHEALARARGGARQIVFVTGEPGIGKTSLVRA